MRLNVALGASGAPTATLGRWGAALVGRDRNGVGDEDQRLVRLDATAALAVGEVRWDEQQAAAALLDALQALVPARDDLTGAQVQVECLTAVVRVVQDLLVRLRHQQVVHLQLLAGLRAAAGARGQVLDDQLLRRVTGVRDGDFGLFAELPRRLDVVRGALAALALGGLGGVGRRDGRARRGRRLGFGVLTARGQRQRRRSA